MNKEIIVFSRYFGYKAGGAERSTFEILKQKEREGYVIKVVLVDSHGAFSTKQKMDLPSHWKREIIHLKFSEFRWFAYLAYFLNKNHIASFFKNINSSAILYSYGIYAPAAINSYCGKTVYLVRDETGIGWNINYNSKFKYFTLSIQTLLDSYWRKSWYRELLGCMKKSHIIVNSKFLDREVIRLTGQAPELIYPYVDKKKLQSDFNCVTPVQTQKKGIVMVGHSRIKGSDIFKRIASHFPSENFYIFAKEHTKYFRKKNIHYMLWQKESADVYKYAKLILVPSRWQEAFGRVIVEARALDIPVIASRRGGIPEAMQDDNFLIDDLENIQKWVKKIESVLQPK